MKILTNVSRVSRISNEGKYDYTTLNIETGCETGRQHAYQPTYFIPKDKFNHENIRITSTSNNCARFHITDPVGVLRLDHDCVFAKDSYHLRCVSSVTKLKNHLGEIEERQAWSWVSSNTIAGGLDDYVELPSYTRPGDIALHALLLNYDTLLHSVNHSKVLSGIFNNRHVRLYIETIASMRAVTAQSMYVDLLSLETIAGRNVYRNLNNRAVVIKTKKGELLICGERELIDLGLIKLIETPSSFLDGDSINLHRNPNYRYAEKDVFDEVVDYLAIVEVPTWCGGGEIKIELFSNESCSVYLQDIYPDLKEINIANVEMPTFDPANKKPYNHIEHCKQLADILKKVISDIDPDGLSNNLLIKSNDLPVLLILGYKNVELENEHAIIAIQRTNQMMMHPYDGLV